MCFSSQWENAFPSKSLQQIIKAVGSRPLRSPERSMQSASRRLGAAVYSESVGGLSLGCRVGLPRKFQLTEIVLKPKLYHSQLLADHRLSSSEHTQGTVAAARPDRLLLTHRASRGSALFKHCSTVHGHCPCRVLVEAPYDQRLRPGLFLFVLAA